MRIKDDVAEYSTNDDIISSINGSSDQHAENEEEIDGPKFSKK